MSNLLFRVMFSLRISLFILLLCFTLNSSFANRNPEIGALTTERTCFDVLHYSIAVTLFPEKHSIKGSNNITFKMVSNSNKIRLDFSKEMHIEHLKFKGKEIPIFRNENTFYVAFNEILQKDSIYSVEIDFYGRPHIALWPPWKGGFVWSKDNGENNWIGLACESLGAHSWLPCKDHWSDEADSIDMFLTVPEQLTGVSNGKLIAEYSSDSGFKTFHWKTLNPINNYNISINAGKYALIRDTFIGIKTIVLSYYVLEYNRQAAETHFLQVHKMLKAFEHYFGPYPFPEDGYKLVETPYWGMEHQSCIAYGNNYKNNPFGFDFIIIHESGHEWFANNITAKDAADMWIHESFTTYSEALYLEYHLGKKVSLEYLLEEKSKIVGKRPIQGPMGVFYHNIKDADMYYKGTWMLHSMRSMLNNDSIWFSALRGINDTFKHSIVDYIDIIGYYNRNTNRNWDIFFKQYLTQAKIPVLKIKRTDLKNGQSSYTLTLKNCVDGLVIPLNIKLDNSVVTLDLEKGKTVKFICTNTFDLYAFIKMYYLLKVE